MGLLTWIKLLYLFSFRLDALLAQRRASLMKKIIISVLCLAIQLRTTFHNRSILQNLWNSQDDCCRCLGVHQFPTSISTASLPPWLLNEPYLSDFNSSFLFCSVAQNLLSMEKSRLKGKFCLTVQPQYLISSVKH